MSSGRRHFRVLALWALSALSAILALRVAPAAADASADGDAELGRLFLAPPERRVLDERREQLADGASAASVDGIGAGGAPNRRVVLNGLVRRAGAPPVVWIDGRPVGAGTHGAASARQPRVLRGPDSQDRVTVESPRDAVSARLKPGQAWDPVTGKIEDCTSCGAPPPAAPSSTEPASGEPAPHLPSFAPLGSTPAPLGATPAPLRATPPPPASTPAPLGPVPPAVASTRSASAPAGAP